MTVVDLVTLIASILIVWFQTDVFVEYARLFRLTRFFCLKEYLTIATEAPMSYMEFLQEYHSNFFTRLITCPICLSVWLSGILVLVTGLGLVVTPMVFLFSLTIYLIVAKLL